MPRPPRPRRGVPYQEAMDALRRLHLILIKISGMPRLPQAARVELRKAITFLAVLLTSDNGRSR